MAIRFFVKISKCHTFSRDVRGWCMSHTLLVMGFNCQYFIILNCNLQNAKERSRLVKHIPVSTTIWDATRSELQGGQFKLAVTLQSKTVPYKGKRQKNQLHMRVDSKWIFTTSTVVLVLSAYLPILLILKQHTQLFHTVDGSFGNVI